MPVSTATTIVSHILNQHQSQKNQKELLAAINKILSQLTKTERLVKNKLGKNKLTKGEKVLLHCKKFLKEYIAYLYEIKTSLGRKRKKYNNETKKG